MGRDNTNQRSRRLLGHSWITLSAPIVGLTNHSLGFGGLCADSCRWSGKGLVATTGGVSCPSAGKNCHWLASPGPCGLARHGVLTCLSAAGSLGQNAATLGRSRPLTLSCSYTEIMPARPQGLAVVICGGLSQPRGFLCRT